MHNIKHDDNYHKILRLLAKSEWDFKYETTGGVQIYSWVEDLYTFHARPLNILCKDNTASESSYEVSCK